MDYQSSGVDIDAGNEVVRRIRSLAEGTFTPGVLSEIGSFGGLFSLAVARRAGRRAGGQRRRRRHQAEGRLPDSGIHDTVGEDLVNHCVNDILVQGAEPLFFLDYLATGQAVARRRRRHRRRAWPAPAAPTAARCSAARPPRCRASIADGEYDLAGFIVGAVAPRPDDRRQGHRAGRRRSSALPSSGLHTNGYSLARSIVFEHLGLTVSSRRRRARHDGRRRRCWRRTAPICRSSAPLLGAGLLKGHGPHHRRRRHRQPAARAARGDERRDRSPRLAGAAAVRLAGRRRRRAARGRVAHLQHGHGPARRRRARRRRPSALGAARRRRDRRPRRRPHRGRRSRPSVTATRRDQP